MTKKMQIDEDIERHVRAAFEAVVGHDAAGLKAALGRVGGGDRTTAASYALYVCGFVVTDVLDGELSEDGVTEMAQYAVADNKNWFDLGDPIHVAHFLKGAASGEAGFPGVPDENVAGYSFVVGGYLLSNFSPKNQHWFEYLDSIWNAALAAES